MLIVENIVGDDKEHARDYGDYRGGRRKMPPTCNLDQPPETSSAACQELHSSCH